LAVPLERSSRASALGSQRYRCPATLILAVTLWRPAAAAQQEDHSPGESVTVAPVRMDAAAGACLDLPWHGPVLGLSDRVVSRSCTVEAFGSLGEMEGRAWRYAIYRHGLVYAPDSTTRAQDLDLFPDSVREDELVVLVAEGEDPAAVTPVWHDRLDWAIEYPRPPSLLTRPEGNFLVLSYCLNGTGGCRSIVYRVRSPRDWRLVQQRFMDELRTRLPAGAGTWKGVSLSLDSLTAEAPVYLQGDANCCPTYLARLGLALRGDTLFLADVRLVPR
jgi:hypothetical protein